MEIQIVSYLHHLWSWTWIDTISWVVSSKPFLYVFFAMIIWFVLLRLHRTRRMILLSFVLAGALFLLVSEVGIKNTFVDQIGFRSRPYVAYSGDIVAIWTPFSDTSFPSSHMASTVAMLTVLVCFIPGMWPFALGFVLMMGFSRMHNGMHYPSDVLIWSLLWILYGLGWVWLAKKIFRKILVDYKK